LSSAFDRFAAGDMAIALHHCDLERHFLFAQTSYFIVKCRH